MNRQPTNFRPRRSVLFMPGDSLRKINKAAGLDVDCIVMDLEDGVALNQKEAARQTIDEALRTLDFGNSEQLVRLNVIESEYFADDLAATIGARPAGFVIPKVEQARQLVAIDEMLAEAEATHGWPANSLQLLAQIETALGVVNLKEIAQATPRLVALMIGAEYLASNIGAKRTRAGWEMLYARSAVVTTAAAFGLDAIDMIFVDLNDLDGLAQECQFGCELGFDGKMAIHPKQVAVIHQVYAPSAAEIERAQRLIAAHDEHQAAGAGAFNFEGQMVDMPVVRAAEQVIGLARQAGLVA